MIYLGKDPVGLAFLNTVIGAGRGLPANAAVIHIVAMAGSTIILSKNNETIETLDENSCHIKSNDNTKADWYFIVQSDDYGTWTITASKDYKDETTTVTVNTNKQYDVIMPIDKYLFKEGEGTLTGYSINWFSNQGNPSITDDYIEWSTVESLGNQVWISPFFEDTDILLYKTLNIEFTTYERDSSNYNVKIGVGVDLPSGLNASGTWAASSTVTWKTSERGIHSCDISNVASNFYIKLAAYGITGRIHNIWLSS